RSRMSGAPRSSTPGSGGGWTSPSTAAACRRPPPASRWRTPRGTCPATDRCGGTSMDGKPELTGRTVVVIGGSQGIGLETARLAREEGADVIITARNADRLHQVGVELGAGTAAFDATDFDRLERFFDELGRPVDHVLVTGPGPYYAPLSDFDVAAARR